MVLQLLHDNCVANVGPGVITGRTVQNTVNGKTSSGRTVQRLDTEVCLVQVWFG